MATYYIDPGGNNSDPGTVGSPRLTLSGGIALLSATDTLIVNDGSYTGNSQWWTNVIPNGTSTSSYTKIQAANDYQAIIRNPAGSNYAVWLPDQRQYVWLHGFLVQGGTSTGSRSGNGGFAGCKNVGTTSNYGEYIKFTNFKIKWFNKTGLFANCNNSLFSEFESFQNGEDADHDHGAYISGTSHHNIYEHCDLWGNISSGLQFYSSGQNPNNHILRYFRAFDNGKNGAVNYRERNALHYGIVYGNNAGVILRSGSFGTCFNVIAYGNVTGINVESGMSNAQVRNCIALGNSSSQYNNSEGSTVASNNVFSGTTASAIWTDPANDDFSLKNTAGTPAADVTTYLIDQGVGVGLTADGEGTSVPQGEAVDIGHLEWASDPPNAPSATHESTYTVSTVYGDVAVTLVKGTNNIVECTLSGTGKAALCVDNTNVTVVRN